MINKILVLLLVVSLSFVSKSGIAQEFDDGKDTTQLIVESAADDEFSSDEFSSGEDSFSNSDDDSFSNSDDEFSDFSESDESFSEKTSINWHRFNWAIGILFFTLLAGILVRYEKAQKLRPIFLLAAVVILGFYRGGPGIISSFQNTYLVLIGVSWKWTATVLFVGVIILTYFQGKVFCGWICYLGAIQEFLYIGKIKIFQTEKAQKVMRIIRYVLLALILLQLTITQSIEWSRIGPFKVIFNLFSPNITGYILLVILLLSSLFIHRPFCKVVCPAGLIFGWVTKLPGASVLGITDSCAGCKTCNTSCQINAITRDDKTSKLDNQECIMCGECLSDCKISSIQPFKKSNKHKNKIILKGIKKLKT